MWSCAWALQKNGNALKCLQDIGRAVQSNLPEAELRLSIQSSEDPFLMILLEVASLDP